MARTHTHAARTSSHTLQALHGLLSSAKLPVQSQGPAADEARNQLATASCERRSAWRDQPTEAS
eukprot:10958104-Alexandrium_andersonii.AAC.1